MSTQRGNASRTRAQKHKNRTVFRNDMHDKTPKQKMLNTLHISEVCQHCKGVIEWKIKYKKYKPLTQPKTCTRCQQRNIRKAYHVLCRGCALDARVCAKCLKSADEVEIEPPGPTPEEQLQLKVEMERLVKSFPERKRRAFLRYMEKGKKQAVDGDEEDAKNENGEDNIENSESKNTEVKAKPRVPHSRDDLLKKIEQLKLDAGNEFDIGTDSDDDYSDSEYDDDDDDDDDDDVDDDDDDDGNDNDDEGDHCNDGNEKKSAKERASEKNK